MKKVGTFFAIVGAIGVIAVVAITLRYGAVNTARTEAELYRWRLSWADRR